MPIFGWLISLFTGPVIKSVLDSVVGAYKEKLAVENNKDSKATELAVKELEAEIEARKQAAAIVIAEQGNFLTRMIRPLFALPLIIYWWKCIFIDKVLAWGSTDPINGALGEWAAIIIAAYFVTRPFEKMAYRIFRR